jgi:hypothetical protein
LLLVDSRLEKAFSAAAASRDSSSRRCFRAALKIHSSPIFAFYNGVIYLAHLGSKPQLRASLHAEITARGISPRSVDIPVGTLSLNRDISDF